MSPIKIHILLEIYHNPNIEGSYYILHDMLNCNFSFTTELIISSYIRKRSNFRFHTIDQLQNLEYNEMPFDLTSKGEAFVDALISLPKPKVKWVVENE